MKNIKTASKDGLNEKKFYTVVLIFLIFLVSLGLWLYPGYKYMMFGQADVSYGHTPEEFIEYRKGLWHDKKIDDLDFYSGSISILKKRWPDQIDTEIPVLKKLFQI